jgi:hypothetical protein
MKAPNPNVHRATQVSAVTNIRTPVCFMGTANGHLTLMTFGHRLLTIK